MSDLCQFPDLELPRSSPALPPAAGAASALSHASPAFLRSGSGSGSGSTFISGFSASSVDRPIFVCSRAYDVQKSVARVHTQKIMVHFPVYNIINEGSEHAPRYRSTVLVDGKSFTSPNTFPQKKEAEQNVAQIALDHLSQKMKDESCPLILEDAIYCKSILNEYAVKMKLAMPTYRTIQPQGAVPVFVSSIVFNNITYTGDVGKSKKEAEQLAARAAIQSLYDDSNSKMVLLKTIKSKWKLYTASRETKYSCPVGVNVGGNSEHREALASGPVNYILGHAIPEACSDEPTPHHIFQILRAAAVASSVLGNASSFVPSSAEQQPVAAMNSGKKRSKNKKKGNKKRSIGCRKKC